MIESACHLIAIGVAPACTLSGSDGRLPAKALMNGIVPAAVLVIRL